MAKQRREIQLKSLRGTITREEWAALGEAQRGLLLFREVQADYHPLTRSITVLLVFAAVVGTMARLISPDRTLSEVLLALDPEDLPARVERGLTSDPMLTLLALLIALLVAMAIKRRQILGLLDGVEHYDIGRALAFGYFRNFLVGALQIAQQRKTRLHVFRPANVEELNRYAHDVWPELRRSHGTDVAAELPFRPGEQGLVRRSVVVVHSVRGGTEGDWLVDFPTTLYTVGDYYKAWNDHLEKEGKPRIQAERLPMLQSVQIDRFFSQLDELFEGDTGLEAAGPHVHDAGQLLALRDCLHWDTFDEAKAAAALAAESLAAERQSFADPLVRQQQMTLLLRQAEAVGAQAGGFPQVDPDPAVASDPQGAAGIQRQAQALRDAFAQLAAKAARLQRLG